MKKQFHWILLSLLFFFGGCNPPKEKKTDNVAFFLEADISKYTQKGIPCVNAKIEDAEISVELDLGFSGCLNTSAMLMNRLKNKEYSHVRPIYGIRGKKYDQNVHYIKQLGIGQIHFSGKLFAEDGYSEIFHRDAVISGTPSSLENDGKIGWYLFASSGLLMDLKKGKIACADSLETVKKHGYFQDSYGTSPLSLERDLVEINIANSQRSMRCVLDTGASHTILHREVEIFDPNLVEIQSDFSLGKYKLNPLAFRPYPIRLPISIDAILGMDFFMDHIVFLDFKNSTIYIQRNKL